MIRQRRGHMIGAVRDLERAARRQPSGGVLAFLSWTLAEEGRMEDARRAAADSVATDPLLWIAWVGYVLSAWFDGDFDAAMQRVRHSVEIGDGEPIQVFFHGVVSAYAGRREDACRILDGVAESGAKGISTVAAALSALYRRDDERAGRLLGDQVLRDLATLDKEFSWWLASACSFAERPDEALHWLANAIDLGFVNRRYFAEVDPFLAPLRGDPRFQALMARAREKQRAFGI